MFIHKLLSLLLIIRIPLLFSLNATDIETNSNICGKSDDVLFINSNVDLELVSHCETFNTSLFISGGYQIQSLLELSNTKYITGYLVIIDTHLLEDLYGLHNLVYISGDELYSNNYSVVIRHNNVPSDSDIGLCYVDTINWNLITNKEQWIEDNGNFCPNCDVECNGCWGPGPQLCQQCNNFKSGYTCVNVCPNNINVVGNTCIERLPGEPILLGHAIRYDKILLQFIESNVANGVTLGYDLLMNNILYKQFSLDRDSSNIYLTDNYTYGDSNEIIYSMNIDNLDVYTEYNFSMRVFNSVGYGNYSSPIKIKTLEGIPPTPNAPVASLVYENILVKIDRVSDINGPIIKYKIIDNKNSVKYTGNYINNITVSSIIPNTNYSYLLEVYTTDVLKSISNYSNLVILFKNNNINDNNKKDYKYLLHIIIWSSVGGLILLVILYLIKRSMNRRRRERRARREGDINTTINNFDGIDSLSYNNPYYVPPTNYNDAEIFQNDNIDPTYMHVFESSNRFPKEVYNNLPPLRPKNMMRD